MCILANMMHIVPCTALHHARLALYAPLYNRDCRKQQELHVLHMRDELGLYPTAFWRTRVADVLLPQAGEMNVCCLQALQCLSGSRGTAVPLGEHKMWTYKTQLSDAHVECDTHRAWMVKVGFALETAKKCVLLHERGSVPVLYMICDDKVASKELGVDHVAHMLTLMPNEHMQLDKQK